MIKKYITWYSSELEKFNDSLLDLIWYNKETYALCKYRSKGYRNECQPYTIHVNIHTVR